MPIYKISSWPLIEVVKSTTPEKAIKKFIKYYDFPKNWWQRVQINLEYLWEDFI